MKQELIVKAILTLAEKVAFIEAREQVESAKDKVWFYENQFHLHIKTSVAEIRNILEEK